MSWDAFKAWMEQLAAAFSHKLTGAEVAAYYEALSGYPEPVLEQVRVAISRESSRWPHTADLCEKARGILRSVQAPAVTCDVCWGSSWVPATPLELFQRTYERVERCPQCWTLGRSAFGAPGAS